MPFTHDWFAHAMPNFKKWLAPLAGKPAQGLEIGCYEGKGTSWMLENFPLLNLVVVDTFEGNDEHKDRKLSFNGVYDRFKANVKPWENRVQVFTGRSQDVVRHFSGPFDFAYVDGSHSAPDVLTDACMAFPILAPGGLLIFDDYKWDHYKEPHRNPRMGIDSFLITFEGRYRIISKGYQVCIAKK